MDEVERGKQQRHGRSPVPIACKTHALAAPGARTLGVRQIASGIYRDTHELKINRMVLLGMRGVMVMLVWPNDQVSSVSYKVATFLSCPQGV